MKKPINVYDKKTFYDEQMKPMINELIQTAKDNDVPILITTAVANNEDSTEYDTNVVLAVTELSLFENRIANILFLMNDFYAEAPEEIRNMVQELTRYLRPVIPDLDEKLEIRLTDEKFSEIYRAACRCIELHFPKSVSFADFGNED